jgi:hypothetical protein
MSEAQQDPRDAARRREAETILRRVSQETNPQIGAGANRLLLNMRAHLSAVDADPDDRMEVLGTRVGRILGLAAFLVMAVWLVLHFLQSQAI